MEQDKDRDEDRSMSSEEEDEYISELLEEAGDSKTPPERIMAIKEQLTGMGREWERPEPKD